MTHATLKLIPAASQRHENLTVFPLTTPRPVKLPYRLLSEAVAAGTLTIGEVGAGNVTELLAVNTGDTAVLILDGEQLLGAKQNRMPGRTMLLPPKSQTKIPVSCMEQGRWHFQSDVFRHAPQHSPSKVRKKARMREAEIAAHGLVAEPEALSQVQGEVWREISEMAADLGEASSTGALDSMYQAREGDLGAWVERFPSVPNQVGLLAFLGHEPLGLDVIGSPELYASLHERLLRGYVLEALWAASKAEGKGAESQSTGADEGAALRYLAAIQKATRTQAPTVGLGTYRVLSGAVVGAELENEGHLVHRAAFPPDGARRRS